MKITYKMPVKANLAVEMRLCREKGVEAFKKRQSKRAEAEKRRKLIIDLRCDWEKERYYGFFKDAEKIADKLRDLGYWVDRYDTISIWGKGSR